MLALGVWQSLLGGIGWVVSKIYDVVPNYGLTIILLTVLIRVVLLPLGIKQIRSMQHMQIIQPKIKQLQTKYKGNRTKQQEEIMKLYKEYGVNPFSGCWPVLLQFPILISMYSVLRYPQEPVHIPVGSELYRVTQAQVPCSEPKPTASCPFPTTIVSALPTLPDPAYPADATIYLTSDGSFYRNVNGRWTQPPLPPDGTSFLGMNLLCSAKDAGNPQAEVQLRPPLVPPSSSASGSETGSASPSASSASAVPYPLDCGKGAATRVPYYAFAALMFGTTYFQQRQMSKATPAGSTSQQQLTLMKIMPLMFGIFGVFFPAGLVIYWTTSNAWQIGQQYFMLKSRPTAETLAARAGSNDKKPVKKGFMSTMMERAQQERTKRDPGASPARKPGTPKPGAPKPGAPKPGSGSKPPPKNPGSGGGSGGDRKKRPKR
jgi:YidC/Oxa1 family membrane protein insertase